MKKSATTKPARWWEVTDPDGAWCTDGRVIPIVHVVCYEDGEFFGAENLPHQGEKLLLAPYLLGGTQAAGYSIVEIDDPTRGASTHVDGNEKQEQQQEHQESGPQRGDRGGQ